MADEQLRQVKHGKQAKPVKVTKKAAVLVKNDEKEKQVENKAENITEVKKDSQQDKKETEVKKEKPKVKKENKHEAIVYGRSLPISLKHSKGIGRFIKNKKIDKAIDDLELVVKKKLAVPMKGELAHRKGKMQNGKGFVSGKYPVKASENFIKLLKTLNANSTVNGLELENTRIREVIVNKAPDQMHRFGRMKFKRTHVMIKSSDVGRKK